MEEEVYYHAGSCVSCAAKFPREVPLCPHCGHNHRSVEERQAVKQKMRGSEEIIPVGITDVPVNLTPEQAEDLAPILADQQRRAYEREDEAEARGKKNLIRNALKFFRF
jgi:hypothetical protein